MAQRGGRRGLMDPSSRRVSPSLAPSRCRWPARFGELVANELPKSAKVVKSARHQGAIGRFPSRRRGVVGRPARALVSRL